MHLIQVVAAFAMVTGRAGSNHIRPDMLTALMAGFYVVHCEAAIPTAAVLAGIIVATEDLPAGKLHPGAGSMDLLFQTDDRRPGE